MFGDTVPETPSNTFCGFIMVQLLIHPILTVSRGLCCQDLPYNADRTTRHLECHHMQLDFLMCIFDVEVLIYFMPMCTKHSYMEQGKVGGGLFC